MKQNHVFSLAALVAAVFSVATALTIVEAQDPGGDNTSPKVPGNRAANFFQNKAVYSTRGAATNAPGMMSSMMGAAAVDDDPEVTELVQAEAMLSHESGEIVQRFAESENAPERKKIMAELRDVLARQFDAQRKRRELELRRIEEQVKKLREQFKKRDDARETIIDRRLDQLINEVDGLGWAPAAGTGPNAAQAMSNFMRRNSAGGDTTPAKNGSPAAR